MFNTIVTVIGGLVLFLGLGSKWLGRSPVPPTLPALIIGFLIGPAVLGWVDLSVLGDRALILDKVARLTLGIALVSVALRIPKVYPRRHWREMLTYADRSGHGTDVGHQYGFGVPDPYTPR